MRWLNRAGATVTLLLGLVIVVETLLELIENGTSIYTEADGLVWYALILTHLVSVGLFVGGNSGRCELGGLPRMRHKPRLVDLLNLVN